MKKENILNEIKKNRFNLILLFFMLVDYIYTYLGVNYYKCIKEGNPLMLWLFDLPFKYGILIRLLYSGIIALLFFYIQSKEYKHYISVINFVLSLNICVILLHFYWLFYIIF